MYGTYITIPCYNLPQKAFYNSGTERVRHMFTIMDYKEIWHFLLVQKLQFVITPAAVRIFTQIWMYRYEGEGKSVCEKEGIEEQMFIVQACRACIGFHIASHFAACHRSSHRGMKVCSSTGQPRCCNRPLDLNWGSPFCDCSGFKSPSFCKREVLGLRNTGRRVIDS